MKNNTKISLSKLMFINNALNDGWTIYKQENKYIFKKKHHNTKEFFEDDFLDKFIEKNITYIK